MISSCRQQHHLSVQFVVVVAVQEYLDEYAHY